MLDRVKKSSNLLNICLIILVGFGAYFRGLRNQFLGDDSYQIVVNPVVHSISNIRLFFEGGTFYNVNQIPGKGPLVGTYYRPLMTTVFSTLYTVFGAHPFYFHLLQLLLFIGSSLLLFLILRYILSPSLSLFLTLIFLVHPINSQIVFALASMQDTLCLFFGMFALWTALKFTSIKSLVVVVVSLLLAMFSKESSIVFILVVGLLLYWFGQRKRFYSFIAFMIVPIVVYLTLKIHAVGLFGTTSGNAPIDRLSLAGRLLTTPSILQFYIFKLLSPFKLAATYYWTYPTFSFRHVLIPLVADLLFLAVFVYLGIVVRRRAPKNVFFMYLFFAVWFIAGMMLIVQIIPLDMTACEAWFYMPMIGLLGMGGIALATFKISIKPRLLQTICVILLSLLVARSMVRASDWSNISTLTYHDIKSSEQNYSYDDIVGYDQYQKGNYKLARSYGEQSVKLFPLYINNLHLGVEDQALNDYASAAKAYNDALKYSHDSLAYENLGSLSLFYGIPETNIKFLIQSLKMYPTDGSLWLDLAVLESKVGNSDVAKGALQQAINYGARFPKSIYDGIADNKPYVIPLASGQTLNIP